MWNKDLTCHKLWEFSLQEILSPGNFMDYVFIKTLDLKAYLMDMIKQVEKQITFQFQTRTKSRPTEAERNWIYNLASFFRFCVDSKWGHKMMIKRMVNSLEDQGVIKITAGALFQASYIASGLVCFGKEDDLSDDSLIDLIVSQFLKKASWSI